MMTIELILDALGQRNQRATYGAVAALTRRPAAFLMAGRPRDWRHSWIVNHRTGLPTGYGASEIHPALESNPKVIDTPQELASWLATQDFIPVLDVEPALETPDVERWANLTTGELLDAYSGVMRALRSRRIIRSSNNPVADLAENLASRAFGLALSEKSAKGYDGIDGDGGRWQIKGRRQTPENKSTQLGVLRGLDEHRFDWLLAIMFDEQFRILSAYRMSHAAVREHARFSRTQQAHVLHLKSSLLSDARCVNIKSEVQAAAEEYFAYSPEVIISM